MAGDEVIERPGRDDEARCVGAPLLDRIARALGYPCDWRDVAGGADTLVRTAADAFAASQHADAAREAAGRLGCEPGDVAGRRWRSSGSATWPGARWRGLSAPCAWWRRCAVGDRLDDMDLAALTREAERLGYVRDPDGGALVAWRAGAGKPPVVRTRAAWVGFWVPSQGDGDEAAALRWLLATPEAQARAACYARGVADGIAGMLEAGR